MLIFCSFSLKGRSHWEEPSRTGGSDEPSLQLLFIIINFLISITSLNARKRPPSTSEKSCRKAASPAESPRFMSHHPKWCTLLCSVPHSLLPCRFLCPVLVGVHTNSTHIQECGTFPRFTGNRILKSHVRKTGLNCGW